MLGAGTVLDGRFKIEEIIGRGGMGAVYRAHDSHSDRAVAIKELLVHLENPYEKEAAIKQFEREAKMLVRLSHPGIPEQLGYFVHGESAYLAMEFVEGTTLESIVCENEELPKESTVIEWGKQLCDVLDYLHDLTPPIIFRDLKPSNVMLAGQQIKLIDFGIAKRLDPIMQTASILKGSGTPGYAPMEQYGKGSTDPRSDIYSLGATLYFLLTGRDPPQSVDIASGVDVLVPPRAYNQAISEAMEAVILKMMALKKEDRHQSASEVERALEACKTSAGLTVIRIPSRNDTGELKGNPLNVQTVRRNDGALVAPTARPVPVLQVPPRETPRGVVLAIGLGVVGVLLYFLISNPPWARPVSVRVVVDSDRQAAEVEQDDLGKGVHWIRTQEPRLREVPSGGWTLEFETHTASQADNLVKSLSKEVPVVAVTRADTTPGVRLVQSYASPTEAKEHEKDMEKKVGLPASIVQRTRHQKVTVIVLETTVRGKAEAEALRKDLEGRQMDVQVTP